MYRYMYIYIFHRFWETSSPMTNTEASFREMFVHSVVLTVENVSLFFRGYPGLI